jgi:alkanesulfonate monooxygenase SsuD/methylene tetrahydromethanopterin reductase-like flavin-dependent oxidoreductase (luciferase family)
VPAVRYAAEYNTFASPALVRERRALIDAACERGGRDPATLPLSLMTGVVIGRTAEEVRERGRRLYDLTRGDGDLDAWLEARGRISLIGTVEEVAGRLRALEAVGVTRVMLQHLDHRDLDTVALLGEELAPAVA